MRRDCSLHTGTWVASITALMPMATAATAIAPCQQLTRRRAFDCGRLPISRNLYKATMRLPPLVAADNAQGTEAVLMRGLSSALGFDDDASAAD